MNQKSAQCPDKSLRLCKTGTERFCEPNKYKAARSINGGARPQRLATEPPLKVSRPENAGTHHNDELGENAAQLLCTEAAVQGRDYPSIQASYFNMSRVHLRPWAPCTNGAPVTDPTDFTPCPTPGNLDPQDRWVDSEARTRLLGPEGAVLGGSHLGIPSASEQSIEWERADVHPRRPLSGVVRKSHHAVTRRPRPYDVPFRSQTNSQRDSGFEDPQNLPSEPPGGIMPPSSSASAPAFHPSIRVIKRHTQAPRSNDPGLQALDVNSTADTGPFNSYTSPSPWHRGSYAPTRIHVSGNVNNVQRSGETGTGSSSPHMWGLGDAFVLSATAAVPGEGEMGMGEEREKERRLRR
ncbi:hypothetical protein B0H13DRAFT_1859001 [Mycena leptocephala]|nr:hypothetical protein B0H13DRAFT_1859001 [Mycena leptocephala]